MNKSIALLGYTLLLSAAPAFAADDAQLAIDLTGSIEPRCELTNIEQETVDFLESESQVISFALYCNLEMSVRLESRNGGLLNADVAAHLGNQDDLNRSYRATFSIPKNSFEKILDSKDMIGGTSFPVTGEVLFDAAGTLEIVLDKALDEGHAGTYSDEVKLSVFPSLATGLN